MKILKPIIFLIIGFLLMYFAFKDQNILELIDRLKSVEIKWVIFSMCFGALAIVSRGIRWTYMIKALGYKNSLKNSISAVAIGYVSNIIIPRAGEITRCTTINRVEKTPFDKLFGTIILERIIDLIILCLMIGITFIFQFDNISIFFKDIFSIKDGNFLIAIFLVFSFLLAFILYILKDKIKNSSLYVKIVNILKGLKEGLSSYKNIQNKQMFWFHTFMIWLMYILMTFICFFAIEETKHLNIGDGFYMLVVGGLGMIVPTQGGIGSYHMAAKIGLITLGVGAQAALMFAFIVHTAQTLMTIVFGLLSFIIILFSKKND